MPEIIERGNLPSEKQYVAICQQCKTKFSFLRHEAEYQSSYRNERYLTIDCPLEGCTQTVYLEI